MKPTELLSAEHRVIEQGLDCLEELSRRCASEGSLDGEIASRTLEFVTKFADAGHHAKEERHLFGMMERRGYPRGSGPVAVMIAEHEQGRAHVRAMAENVEAAAAGDTEACALFTTRAGLFVSLLRQHIQKEDHCLFPMADSALDARLQEELEGLFADADGAAAETREKCLALVDTIAERLGLNGGRGAAHSAATAGATVARSPHA